MLFVMGVGFLLDSPLIVFHSMCVFRLWTPVSVKKLFPYARSVCLYGLADVLV